MKRDSRGRATGAGRAFVIALVAGSCAVPHAVAQRPIAFGHGLTGDGSAWASTAQWLEGELHIEPVLPTMGWAQPFGVQAGVLHQALNGYDDVIGIASSNGGVVFREYLHSQGAQARMNGIVAVGSLHQGAVLANAVLGGYVAAYLNNICGALVDPFVVYNQLDGYFEVPSLILTALGTVDVICAYGAVLASLGFSELVDVSHQMAAGSTYMTGLNSSANLATEAQNTVARVGIGTSVQFENSVFRPLTNNTAVLGAAREAIRQFADAAFFHYIFHPDPTLQAHAWMWDELYWYMADMDLDWAWLVGAYAPGLFLLPHDGILPIDTQQYPGATEQQDFLAPYYDIYHEDQKNHSAIRVFLRDALQGHFGVDTPPTPPPPPPPPPPESPEGFTAWHNNSLCPDIEIQLDWQNSGLSEPKVIERDVGMAGMWALLATPSAQLTQFVDATAPADEFVEYRIRWDSGTQWSYSDAIFTTCVWLEE